MTTQEERISPDAYQALREALSSIFWFRSSFHRYLRTALRDVPEVLVGVNWDGPKREAVDNVVDALMTRERRYRTFTLDLMVAVANRTDFREIEPFSLGIR